MTKTELEPCPFCGSRDFVVSERKDFVSIKCGQCKAKIGALDEKTAVEYWNTRPVEDELKKYEAALIEIYFCCAAVDCSLEQQSEALKAIDQICAKFYSVKEGEE